MITNSIDFPSDSVIKLFNEIQQQYFNGSLDVFLTPSNVGYVTEATIKSQMNLDYERQIGIWLWRIQRYFLISNENESPDSKKNTAVLLDVFLQDLDHFPEHIKRYLCRHEHAINCLIISLLVNRQQKSWDYILQLLAQYNKETALLPLLHWVRALYFDKVLSDCEGVLISLMEKKTSPIIPLVKHVALSQWYEAHPTTHPVSKLKTFLPSTSTSSIITSLPYVIKKGIYAEIFSNHLPVIQNFLYSMVKQFLMQFRASKYKEKHSLREFNTPQFKGFLNYFIRYALCHLEQFEQYTHLVGLSQAIKFYTPEDKNYFRSLYDKELLLVKKLFLTKQYFEAYELYKHAVGTDNSSEARTKNALYWFVARINAWLDDIEGSVFKWSDKELETIVELRADKLLDRNTKVYQYQNEIPEEPLYWLAKRLGSRFQSSNDKVIRTHYNNSFLRIFTCLTREHQREVALLFRSSPKNHTAPQKTKLNPNAKEFTFFTSPKMNKATPLALQRKAIPEKVINIIDYLRAGLLESKLYLTGAAPADILDGKKPRDYDILVLNSSLSDIAAFLKEKGFKPEVRSKTYPILFCDLGDGITLDFVAKKMTPTDTIETVLKADFAIRDFNFNAIYSELTQESEFPLFSFADALEQRNARIITSIQDPVLTFTQDPTRLFRLVKLLINHPNDVMAIPLQQALTHLSGKWIALLNQFVKEGHRDRLRHAINKLFSRYSYSEINGALEKMGGLKELSNNNHDAVDEACAKIPSLVKKEQRFLYWVLANILQKYQSGSEYCLCPTHDILLSLLDPLEQDYLEFIYDKAPGRYSEVEVYVDDVRSLVDGFKLPRSSENTFLHH